jgi:hypothetical protein
MKEINEYGMKEIMEKEIRRCVTVQICQVT